jgi:hypothetical protein
MDEMHDHSASSPTTDADQHYDPDHQIARGAHMWSDIRGQYGSRRTIRRRRRLIEFIVVSLFLGVAVGVHLWTRSGSKSADEYARQACAAFPFSDPAVGATGGRDPLDASTLDDTVSRAGQAASSAASAAKRAGQWDSLGRAYSTLLDSLTQYAQAVRSVGVSNSAEMSQQWHNRYSGAVSNILAECRKANAR